MTLGGLFSGIGGFELAAQRAGITPLWSNEIDPFCCKVLRKNFSHEIIEADIRDCGAGRKYKLAPVDVICGGFPCQPFSTAGKRKGKNDNRYLWPEMLRTIREVKPAWVVGENVAGILSMDGGAVFDQICASLEDEGYQVEAYNIPACGIGAPRRRERIWIVAHSKGDINRRKFRESHGSASKIEKPQNKHENQAQRSISTDFATTNPVSERWISGGFQGEQRSIPKTNGAPTRCELDRTFSTAEQWQEHWLQVATRICRMDDGVPRRVDRTNRLKALGNAIVPQVAQVIFEAILQVETLR